MNNLANNEPDCPLLLFLSVSHSPPPFPLDTPPPTSLRFLPLVSGMLCLPPPPRHHSPFILGAVAKARVPKTFSAHPSYWLMESRLNSALLWVITLTWLVCGYMLWSYLTPHTSQCWGTCKARVLPWSYTPSPP
jgi:hypothetical protein